MEGLALLALILLGLLVATPFVAFSALNKSKQALAALAEQKALVAALQDDIARLRRRGGLAEPLESVEADAETGAPLEDQPTDVAPPEAPQRDAAPIEPPVEIGPAPALDEPQPELIAARAAADAIEPIAAPTPSDAASDAPSEPPVLDVAAKDATPEDIIAAPAEPPRARDFEESIGSRWAVWVGGFALAIGGLFLVRYSIEMGVFGPGVRLLMGAAFAIACGVASEYVRRSDLKLSLGRLPPTQIPAVLAGVSVLSAFGVVYAAHGIYGFIGPTLAFTLMGAIGVGALLVSLVHGPLFGLFGLVGSYATPLLVASTAPAFASLSLFIAAVTSVAFALHAQRPQRIVTLGAVAGHTAWTWLIATYEPGGKTWSALLLMVAAALGLALLKEIPALRSRAVANDNQPTNGWFARRFDPTAFVALAAPLVLAGVIWVAFGGPAMLHAAIIVAVIVGLTAATRHDDLAPLALLTGAGATGMILLWPTIEGPIGVTPWLIADLIRLDLAPNAANGIIWTALLFAAAAFALPFHALFAKRGAGDGDVASRGAIAFASSLTPVCILLAVALRVNGFNRSTLLSLIALALTALLFAASELILKVERERTKARDNPLALIGSAAYAAAGAIALGLAIAFALRETWLVVGLAIAALGVAVVATVRPIPLLRSMSAALATAAFGRLIWQPILFDVGSWPLFNWLIPAYALPTLCFGVAALLFSGKVDRPLRVHQALFAFFGAAFVLLEVRQFFAGPDLVPTLSLIAGHWDQPRNRLYEELFVQVVAIGGLGVALQWLNRRAETRVFLVGADLAAMALIVAAFAALGGLFNPLFDGTSVLGPAIFNRLLLYPLVGALLGALAFVARRKLGRSRMTDALDAVGAVLFALGSVLIVRHAFAGPRLVVTPQSGVGYFEIVALTIVLLALTCAARIWMQASGGRVAAFVTRALALLAVAWAVLGLALGRNPMLDLSGVEGPIVFNRILWGYGPVALGFAGAGFWMREAAPGIASLFKKSAAGFALLAAFLLMRHGFHGRLLVSDEQVTLAEAGFYSAIAFIAAIILAVKGSFSLLGRPAKVSPAGAAIASTAVFAIFPFFVANPLVTGAPLAGRMILDNALIGFLMPAVFAFVAARWAREHSQGDLARRVWGAAAIAGGFAYLMIEVRRWFVGPDLWAESGNETELYAYSAAILLYGLMLLILGFRLASKDLRLAAMVVITLAVCKAFLIDMAGLEGLLRALSFIGLGGSLVGIGLVYQRLLQREALKPTATAAARS